MPRAPVWRERPHIYYWPRVWGDNSRAIKYQVLMISTHGDPDAQIEAENVDFDNCGVNGGGRMRSGLSADSGWHLLQFCGGGRSGKSANQICNFTSELTIRTGA